MGTWRLIVGVVLGVLVGGPLVAPLASLFEADAWAGWGEVGRLLALARNTSLLVSGTLLLCVPAGVFLAVLLYRTDLPGRRLLRSALVLMLFVPLPLFAAGWQRVLAAGAVDWSPWAGGLVPAIWVHAVAGLPWVVWLTGQGLLGVERELEEDALTAAAPWRVLWAVTLPRAGPAVGAAALWVAVQAAGEITVTDLVQVRTFAEEVYVQRVGPEADAGGVGRAVAVALPQALLVVLLAVWVVRRWEQAAPPRVGLVTPPLLFRLRRGRGVTSLLVALIVCTLIGVPLGNLVWQTGLSGVPAAWSAGEAWRQMRLVTRADGGFVLGSVVLATLAGVSSAALALVVCWVARGSAAFRTGLVALLALAWTLPGPLVGVGVKSAVEFVLDVTGSDLLARVLHHGPSPGPLWWVDVVRLTPLATAVLWPVVRALPADLFEAARIDGARPWQEFALVVWPLAWPATFRAAAAVAILSLGELSAGKLVSTPGWPGFAEVIFTQMHYGFTPDLAARCLLLLGVVTAAGILMNWLSRPRVA